MSNRLLTAAWKARGLRPGARLVLLAMADLAREPDCVCFARHDTLAAMCELSEKHLGTVIRELKNAKHITETRKQQRTTKGGMRFSYLVHPLTPEASSGVTHEVCRRDAGTLTPPHSKSAATTHELASAPIQTSSNPINPKRSQPPPPLPSHLPELITSLKKQITKTPASETGTLDALWLKLGEYETQKFGTAVTKRTPAEIPAKPATTLHRFTPSRELGEAFRNQARAAMEQTQ